MKILVVCQHFFPENFRINDICYELAKKGHEVTVLTGLPNYPEGKVLKEYKWFRNRKQEINNVKIIRCSLVGRRTSLIMMAINYMWFALFGSLKAFFMKKNFDIVYSYQLSPITMVWPAIVVSKIKKIPLIIHCLDQWPISVTTGPISKESMLYRILQKISVSTYRKADKILISSKSFKKYFEETLHITKEEKGLIYYPSYAENEYENVGAEKNEVFDVVFAGNIGPAQDVETIIEAANILKGNENIHFHIVGDGLNKQACEKKSIDLGLSNVTFYGFHNVAKMPEFYRLADCFVITMVDNVVVNSTLPAKIQSYMLAKKPIVGAINGEVEQVVKESGCGLCCDSGDAQGLSKLVIKLYEDADLCEECAKKAYDYYKEHFDKDICIQRLEKIFDIEIEVKT